MAKIMEHVLNDLYVTGGGIFWQKGNRREYGVKFNTASSDRPLSTNVDDISGIYSIPHHFQWVVVHCNARNGG